MPLDIAMQNAQLKNQLMSTILIIFCVLELLL
jgi:hypothetical protein